MQGKAAAGVGGEGFGAEPVLVVVDASGGGGEGGGGPRGHLAEGVVAGGFGDGAGGVGEGDDVAVRIVVIPPWLRRSGDDLFHEEETADATGGVEAAAEVASPSVAVGLAGGGAGGSGVGGFLNEVELVPNAAGAGLGGPNGGAEGLRFGEDKAVEGIVTVQATGGGAVEAEETIFGIPRHGPGSSCGGAGVAGNGGGKHVAVPVVGGGIVLDVGNLVKIIRVPCGNGFPRGSAIAGSIIGIVIR